VLAHARNCASVKSFAEVPLKVAVFVAIELLTNSLSASLFEEEASEGILPSIVATEVSSAATS